MTTVEVLLKAKNILRDGTRWTRNRYRSEGGLVCVIGAVREVVLSGSAEYHDAYQALHRQTKYRGFTSPERFNDTRDSVEPVLDLIDATIADERRA